MYQISRRNFLRTSIVLSAGMSLGVSGCGGDSDDNPASARFAVLSDPHIYDPSLGTTGTAFETYLSSDRKMLAESVEILEAVVNDLTKADLNFVLVPGDLTKDGEYICHEKFISIMSALQDKGVKVYVVPGNHDINNPHAVSFDGNSTSHVPSVTSEDFEKLYDDFGYGKAKYRDSNSLSYVAELTGNVWLFAIDSCKYDNNDTYPETSGAISDETFEWLSEKLAEAERKGKLCIGMLHHNVIPHFSAQTTFFSEYVVDDYDVMGKKLADAGLGIIFTGHFHAQDIIRAEYDTSTLYEVETGSTVTAPCPYRIIDLDIRNAALTIESHTVESIPSVDNFNTYKTNFTASGMLDLYTALLPSYGIDPSVAPAASEIHVMHYAGDEKYSDLSTTADAIIQSLLTSGDTDAVTLGYALTDWAADNAPNDNDTNITL
ncbi:metallophosphoesterase [Denitrovibrio acetiphilus DSM 12809]|uniref:Metallophosphoesterase n=1 Tax=Denitrovibrio acetiphilus (strain DSM 12809 / NBRC 114555 / N2460) TaxID=522772 RepID=D4H515_DENA2|nr:metallophosphoesterase [Denitrovibrio acetiphilus]ADD69371.1 metallophosphoesterase [Denitrovibrio acetiphilus DSM 12809]